MKRGYGASDHVGDRPQEARRQPAEGHDDQSVPKPHRELGPSADEPQAKGQGPIPKRECTALRALRNSYPGRIGLIGIIKGV